MIIESIAVVVEIQELAHHYTVVIASFLNEKICSLRLSLLKCFTFTKVFEIRKFGGGQVAATVGENWSVFRHPSRGHKRESNLNLILLIETRKLLIGCEFFDHSICDPLRVGTLKRDIVNESIEKKSYSIVYIIMSNFNAWHLFSYKCASYR